MVAATIEAFKFPCCSSSTSCSCTTRRVENSDMTSHPPRQKPPRPRRRRRRRAPISTSLTRCVEAWTPNRQHKQQQQQQLASTSRWLATRTSLAADVATKRPLVDIVADKAAFLLTFENARVDEALVDVKHCCFHSSQTSTTTVTGDAHQADAYPSTSFNACTQAQCHNGLRHFLRHAATSAGSMPASFRCVFEFLFDEDINRLDGIDNLPRPSASLPTSSRTTSAFALCFI